MNLVRGIKQLFKPTKGEIEFFDKTTSFQAEGMPIFNTDSDEAYITEGYQKNAAVYSIINMISRNATMIPFKVYRIEDVSKKKDYTALTSGSSTPAALFKASVIKSQAFTEVTDSGILEVLQNPNPSESWAGFIQNYIGFGKLTGNRYIYGIRDSRGRVREMHILPSQHVEIISGGDLEPIAGYKVDFTNEESIDFTRDEVLHVKDFNPHFDFSGSNLYGQSPLKAGWRTLQINNQIQDTTKEQLTSQQARGVLTPQDSEGIDVPTAKQLQAKIKKRLSDASGGIAVSTIPLNWQAFGLSAADMELINQGAVSMQSLCNLYGVPVVLMNDTTNSTSNNIKGAKSFLFQNAVNPEMIRLRDELNRWFVPMWGEDLYLDFDFTVIPELQEEISEMVNQLDKAWYMTPNEKRKTLFLPEDIENEMMDGYYIPVNLMPLKNMDSQVAAQIIDAANKQKPKQGEE